MPEPTSTTAATATILAAGSVVPVVTNVLPTVAPQIVVMGVALGLRADVLLAGFAGSVVAMAFFNTVPSSGDTWRELLFTTWRRMCWALASALSAGYLTPLVLLIEGERLEIPEALMLSMAFVTGAGAQHFVARLVNRFGVSPSAPAAAPGGRDAG